jgi:DNA-binding transcriptional ArsR family regulator
MLRYAFVLVLIAVAAPAAAAMQVALDFDDPLASHVTLGGETVGLYHEEPASQPQPAASPSPQPAPSRQSPPPSERSPLADIIPLIDFPPVLAPVDGLVDGALDTVPLLPARADADASGAPASAAPLAPVYVGHDAPAPAAPATPARALAAVAAVTAAAPVAASGALWERLRRLALAAALYTRIAKERLLDHGGREKLLVAIREHPGAPVTDLSVHAGIPRNTAVYHLHRLEREGLVSSTKNGRMRLYFAPGALDQRQRAPAIAVLRNPVTQRVAAEVGASPGLDQRALCARMGLAPSLAHWHATRLVEAGVMTRERDGRHVRYYPAE